MTQAHQLIRGSIIYRPNHNKPYPVTVARVVPGCFKSTLLITFKGGDAVHVHRSAEVQIIVKGFRQ